MRLSSDQCNHTIYLFSNAASKQPALTPTKLRSSTLSCALCSAGSWQGPSPLVNPCTAVPCSLACRKHMSHREKSQATSSVQEATKRCSTTVSKSSKPVAELRSQHWALGLNLLCIFSLLQPGNRTNWRGKERHKAKMKNCSRDLHSDRVSILLVGPELQATALGTGDAQSQKGWESIKHTMHRQSLAQALMTDTSAIQGYKTGCYQGFTCALILTPSSTSDTSNNG